MYYKFTREDGSATHGSGKWTKNRWRSVTGEVVACQNGIHFCKTEHLMEWLAPKLWVFEDGSPDETFEHDGSKMVTRKGRVVEVVTAWNETTARLFAADCAERVLPLYESRFSDDPRPRAAIEAARAFARGEIDVKQRAAALDAAWAAGDAARDAARDAGDAAWDAAWAAWDAARAAREAARAAWDAAREAAWDAAWAAREAARAARDAAKDAAWDAERKWQTDRLMDYLNGTA